MLLKRLPEKYPSIKILESWEDAFDLDAFDPDDIFEDDLFHLHKETVVIIHYHYIFNIFLAHY